jgi:nitrogen fixation/metabolism regulation signal transduction histidine kinase
MDYRDDVRRPAAVALTHDRRIFLIALLVGAPAVVATLVLLRAGQYPARVVWTVALLVIGAWLGTALYLRERVVRPLQTMANMLAALREGDFSLRGRERRDDDALGLAMLEVNMLSETLRAQRLGAMEATALLRTVMSEIDVAILTFDDDDTLRLVNRAGERLLAEPFERLIGKHAGELGLLSLIEPRAPRVHDRTFPGGAGGRRWEVRRLTFREHGRPHTLVVIADVSRTLREEELLAWQRIVRVLGHEINNSLAPIKSIAGSLRAMIEREPRPADADDDLRSGLSVVQARADALQRFMSSYARLARLPQPVPRSVDVGAWVRRTADLETRTRVCVRPGPDIAIQADGDQLDQLLINLVRNAADATLESEESDEASVEGVRIGWSLHDAQVEVTVVDSGPGLSGTTNLFVPFFTTKPTGSGIGLVLCRQIAEAHGGSLTLENRRETQGCVARLRLPLEFRTGSA